MHPPHVEPWVVAILVVAAMFLAAKLVTLARHVASRSWAGLGRALAYVVLWPGMDAARFFGARTAPTPRPDEWIAPVVETAAGAALAWAVSPRAPAPLASAWVGVVGLGVIAFSGVPRLLTLAWRAHGVAVAPIVRAPHRAASLADFWGRRWNLAFHALARDFVFAPLRPRIGARAALLATFVASGLVHELAVSLPARGGFGLPTLYFTIQGAGVLLERSRLGRRTGLAHGARGRVVALATVVAPLPLLVHRPFLECVALPLLHAIGA